MGIALAGSIGLSVLLLIQLGLQQVDVEMWKFEAHFWRRMWRDLDVHHDDMIQRWTTNHDAKPARVLRLVHRRDEKE